MHNMHTEMDCSEMAMLLKCLMDGLQRKVGELQEGKRSQSGQIKHYKDILKSLLNVFNIHDISIES